MITSLVFVVCLLGSQTVIAETIYYYHNDPVGMPLAMTDESGQKVWEADYLPFGEVHSESGVLNDRKFVGKERDEESDLDYFGARFHYAKVGRFLSVDSVRTIDSSSGRVISSFLENSQRQNTYAYSLNNPYKYVDPDGELPRIVTGRIEFTGGGVGAGASLGNVKVVPRGQIALPGGNGVRPAPIRYNPMNKGPLASDISSTFRSGTYTQKTLGESQTYYRVISENGNPTGRFWSVSKPKGSLQSTIDLALDPHWGNAATKVVKARVPAGTTIYEGTAASQRGLVGGGNQIYIPKVNPKWIEK